MTSSIEQPDVATPGAQPASPARPRVVVGVDASPGSRAALAYALVTAARRGADVEIVSSYGIELAYFGGAPLDVPDPAPLGDDLRTRVEAVAADVLDELSASFAPGIRDIDITHLVTREPAAHALLERSEGAALLVVGNRGRGAMRSALLGSVALHCATHAPCPVVVVHPTAGDTSSTDRILVGIDGSDGSRAALAAAVQEAVRSGGPIEAVVTYVAADYWTDLASVVLPLTEEIRADLEQRTQRLVDEVLAQTSLHPDLPAPVVRITVVQGPAGEVLVHRASPGDLLVVGSRGTGAFRGLLLGSVALHCVMHATCPVMVVHPQRHRSSAATSRSEPAMADR